MSEQDGSFDTHHTIFDRILCHTVFVIKCHFMAFMLKKSKIFPNQEVSMNFFLAAIAALYVQIDVMFLLLLSPFCYLALKANPDR